MKPERDMVNHPNHYQAANGLEAWDVIKAFTSDLVGEEAWGTQQALKYLLRWKHKGGKEDLKKAVNYIQELIKDIEKNEEFEKEFATCLNPPVNEDCSNCIHINDEDADACLHCSKLVGEGLGIENRFVVNDKSRFYVDTIEN